MPSRYWTEEYRVIHFALRFGGGDLNPHFFEYPTLYLYFMFFVFSCFYAISWLLGVYQNTHDFAVSFAQNPTAIYLLSRTMESLWGLALIVIVFLITQKWFGKRAATWAALFTAILPNFVVLGHMTKGDTASLCLLLIYLHFCCRVYQLRKIKDYLLAGLFLGLACSTKYWGFSFSCVFPIAHILGSRRVAINWKSIIFSKNLWLGFITAPFAFVLGSPYIVLDFSAFWKDFHGVLTTQWEFELNWKVRLGVLRGWIDLAGGAPNRDAPFLGLFCLIAILWQIIYQRRKIVLWLIPIIVYTPMVMRTHPEKGYLIPLFPIFLILGGGFLESVYQWRRALWRRCIFTAAFFACLASFIKAIIIVYPFTQKDTRTLAKEWVEKNIPTGSKILMGNYSYSPQLLMTKSQIQRFYAKAQQLGHYKTEYFKLQLEAHPGENLGYELYTIGVEPRMVGAVVHKVQDVQKTQDLLPYDRKVVYLRSQGIQYVIVNGNDENMARVARHDKLVNFYGQLSVELAKVVEFKPGRWNYGPAIIVYRL